MVAVRGSDLGEAWEGRALARLRYGFTFAASSAASPRAVSRHDDDVAHLPPGVHATVGLGQGVQPAEDLRRGIESAVGHQTEQVGEVLSAFGAAPAITLPRARTVSHRPATARITDPSGADRRSPSSRVMVPTASTTTS